MDTLPVALFAATSGVIAAGIGGVVSYLVARKQISSRYSEVLYTARLAAYPELYYLISNLAKETRFHPLTRDFLMACVEKLDDWDSKHALLLSPLATHRIFVLRHSLRNLISDDADLASVETGKSIRTEVASLENALKTELGIFQMPWFHNPRKVMFVNDFLSDKLNKEAKGITR